MYKNILTADCVKLQEIHKLTLAATILHVSNSISIPPTTTLTFPA
ncbi:MAG: hypothetical protein ACQKBV_02990 [Puniceicoccales bacterium]